MISKLIKFTVVFLSVGLMQLYAGEGKKSTEPSGKVTITPVVAKDRKTDVQAKSGGSSFTLDSAGNIFATSLPGPFNRAPELGIDPDADAYPLSDEYYVYPNNEPAISTGYYVVGSSDVADTIIIDTTFVNNQLVIDTVDGWKGFPEWLTERERLDLGLDEETVVVMPNIPSFANPANTDTRDNAFIGPYPIGFPFEYNGRKYDSFYVSSNGVIGLSNARYFYNELGEKMGVNTDSDSYAFENSTNDTTLPDDYGYRVMACGGNPGNPGLGMMRNPNNTSMVGVPNRAPVIAVFWDDLQVVDSLSEVTWWRNRQNTKLTVFIKDFCLRGDKMITSVRFNRPFDTTVNFPLVNGPSEEKATIRFSAQVVFDRINKSVTVNHRFNGAIRIRDGEPTGNFYALHNATIGVHGFARDSNNRYYQQYTDYISGDGLDADGRAGLDAGDVDVDPIIGANGIPSYGSVLLAQTGEEASYSVRFKQWKNLVRVTGIKYFRYGPLGNEVEVAPGDVNNYELLAGDTILGAIRPVMYVQNLSNDIQGPSGVNYNKQGFEFRARLTITDQVCDTVVYSRTVRVDSANIRNRAVYPNPEQPWDSPANSINQNFIDSIFFVERTAFDTYRRIYDDPYPATTNTLPANQPLEVSGVAFADDPLFLLYPNLTNANYKGGVPPYAYIEIKFPPYYPSEVLDFQVGRMEVAAIVEPVLPNGKSIGDRWKFDDTVTARLDVSRVISSTTASVAFDPQLGYRGDDIDGNTSTLATFISNGNDLTILRRGGNIPSVLKWLSYGVDMLDGDGNSFNPPAPNSATIIDCNRDENPFNSPVFRLDRRDDDNLGADWTEKAVPREGDYLLSFPIDMRGKQGSVLSFSYQRTGKPAGYDPNTWPKRNWSDEVRYGPEPRVAASDDIFGNPVSAGDALILDFLNPSAAKSFKRITNISFDENVWSSFTDPVNSTVFPERRPAIIWGGGGFRSGFVTNVAGPAIEPLLQNTTIDVNDDGLDQDFNKFYIPLSSFYNDDVAGEFFRMRFRTSATNDFNAPGDVPGNRLMNDDSDPFFLDNIYIWSPTEGAFAEGSGNASDTVLVGGLPDLEPTAVKAIWPYQIAPPRQASQVPIRIKVANNSGVNAGAFEVAVVIRQGPKNANPPGRVVYARSQTLPFLAARSEIEIPMPNWNGSSGEGEHTMIATIITDKLEVNKSNNRLVQTFTLRYGEVFAYDPEGGQNVAPIYTSFFDGLILRNIDGRGINLFGVNTPSQNAPFGLGGDGTGSGQIGVRFQVTAQDTLKGFQAWFGELNQEQLNIEFSIYKESPQGGPDEDDKLTISRRRGIADVVPQGQENPIYGAYSTYLLDEPVPLQPGFYWISVAQMGSEGFELGVSDARVGTRTTVMHTGLRANGTQNQDRWGFKSYRRRTIDGRLLNQNIFAYQNVVSKGPWNTFLPDVGPPAYGHNVWNGRHPRARGTWVPMLRPYFGKQPVSDPITIDTLVLDRVLPVELVDFTGTELNGKALLAWNTASESGNSGFVLEKTLKNSDEWAEVTFVKGAGDATTPQSYSHVDAEVVGGQTYVYRLHQIDVDGTETLSNTVEVTIGQNVVGFQRNYPNPFSNETTISYTATKGANLKIEIFDAMGNIVRTLLNDVADQESDAIVWNGQNNNGVNVASGAYLCKMTINDEVFTHTINVVR